jgi:hypothetical protein
MTIQQQIKNDLKQAMLTKDVEKKDILRVVIGEFNRVGKEVEDKDATRIIKKMHQNAMDQDNLVEAMILEEYLPQMLSEPELTAAIKGFIKVYSLDSMKGMGTVMTALKESYAGMYDGKVASTIVRELLN